MRKFRFLLSVALILVVALTAYACTDSKTYDINGNEVTIDFGNIEKVEVLNPEILESEGFRVDTFELSQITVHITYYAESEESEGASVDIPLTDNMIKAESKAKLSVPGTHTIYCSYGSKFEFQFKLRLYETTINKYEVTFYDETGNRVVGTQIFNEGEIAVPPAMPTKAGFTLVGWKNKTTGELVTDFTVNSNSAYIAYYQPDFYEVRYYYTVGEVSTLISTATVPRGGNALDYAPEIPIVAGYSNGRWSDENAMQSVGENNYEFYAVYDLDKVLVTFSYYKYIEGEYYDSNVSWGVDLETEGITPPDDVERITDNVFLYWYVERNGEEIKVEFPYKVTGEIKFIAKYVPFATGSQSLVYELDESGTFYRITGLSGSSEKETVVIPQTHLGLPVKEIKEKAFSDKDVVKFAVSATNPYFRAYDGVLYNSSLSELIAYPVGSENEIFTVADNTRIIHSYAFYGARYLEQVVLPSALIEIGKGAFSECALLNSLSVPEGVTVIESEFIKNSKSLTSLTIGSAVTEIKDEAFYGASSLGEIALSDSLNILGDEVFVGCKNLSLITVKSTSSTVRPNFTVSGGALYGYNESKTNPHYYLYAYPAKFSGGSNASEITLNSSVRVVKKGAFSDSSIVGIYTASNNVTFEDESVLCPLLISLRFASGEINFSPNTFGNYKPDVIYLSEYTNINDTLGVSTEIYSSTGSPYRNFENGFAYELDESRNAVIVAYKGKSEKLIIPEKINSFTVGAIKDGVFAGDLSIKELILPDSLTYIGNNAFYGCENLVSVTFGKNLQTIGDYAFADCGESVIFNGGEAIITSLGKDAFGNFSKANADEKGIVSVAGVLLSYVGYEKTVKIPSDISIIAYEAFSQSKYISSIDFSMANNLLAILDDAFNGCEEITDISFPISLEFIGERAFAGCTRLVSVDGKPLSGVADNAFDGAGTDLSLCFETEGNVLVGYNGKSSVVVVPDGITEIGDEVFASDNNIEKVVLSDVLKIGNRAFENSRNLTEVIFSNRLIEVGERAFYGCGRLSNVNINQLTSLTTIAYDAFDGTEWINRYTDDSIIINGIFYKYLGGLTELHIPNSVKSVNDRAFYQNNSLSAVYIPESVEVIGKQAFAESEIERFNFGTRNVAVTEIKESAFENCKNLVYLDIRSLNKLEKIGTRAFAGIAAKEQDVLHIYISATVYEIGNSAFENSEINTLKFESGSKLTEISVNVFSGCTKLESVIFEGESNLIEIMSGAFENCISLKVFNNFVGNIEKIGERAFAGDINLSNFKINDEKLIEIGQDAFEDNEFIKANNDTMVFVGTVLVRYNGELSSTVYIPATTTAIANSAFANSIYIENIVFMSDNGQYNLKEIQDNAFIGCSSLTCIEIPGSVEKIGEYAFSGCFALNSVLFNGGLKEIGSGAFSDCISLKTIALPSTLTEIGGGVFAGCSSLTEINVVNNNKFYSDDGILYSYKSEKDENGIQIRTASMLAYPGGLTTDKGEFIVPETIRIGNTIYNVNSVGDYAFAQCASETLNSIYLRKNIVSIGKNAFSGIRAKIIFADDSVITVFSDYIFAGYEGSEIVIPDSVKEIGGHAFENVVYVESITIPCSVEILGEYAFNGTDMNIEWAEPSNVEILKNYAYAGYKGTEAIIPASVREIGYKAFEGVTSRVIIKAELTEIGDYAFYGYSGTEIPVLPESVVSIGDYAFANMDNVQGSLNIPFGVNQIGEYAFKGLKTEVLFDIDTEISVIGAYSFAGYRGNSIVVPDSITEIGDYAFYNCTNLENIVYGNLSSLNIIGKSAFENSSIRELTVPYTVMEIKEKAFSGISALINVEFGSDSLLESFGIGVFENCNYIEDMVIPFVGDNEKDAMNTHLGYIFGASSYTENESYIPQTLKEITVLRGSLETNSFYNCVNIEKVIAGDGVSDVKEGAFIGCKSVKELTLPYGGVYGMLFGADKYTNNGTYVPSTLEKIAITKIEILAEGALYSIGIRELILPDTLKEIGAMAFFNCSRLVEIDLGAGVVNIGKAAFGRCSALQKINVDRGNNNFVDSDGVLYGFNKETGTAGLIAYPKSKSGSFYEIELIIGNTKYDITEISDYAFYASTLTETEIPESVTSIGSYAFAYSSISSIRIRTDAIGNNAFTGSKIRTIYMENLSSVISANDDKKIYNNAYTVFVMAEYENSIRETTYIYKNFTKLVTELTNRVMKVNKYGKQYIVYYKKTGDNTPLSVNIRLNSADYGSLKIDGEEYSGENLYMPGTVIELEAIPNDGYVFVGWFGNGELISSNKVIQYTVENRNIALSARFVYVGSYGFNTEWSIIEKGDVSLNKDGSIMYYLVSAQNEADLASHRILLFTGKGSLGYLSADYLSHKDIVTAIGIEDGITSIPADAFNGFNLLTDVTISDSVTVIGERAFYNCGNLESVAIPGSVNEIGQSAFALCEKLTDVVLEEGLKEISANAFSGANFVSVTIPASVTVIASDSFSDIAALRNIYAHKMNKYFTSEEGVLFKYDSADYTAELYIFPDGKDGSYIVPDKIAVRCEDYTVVSIGTEAFEGCSALESIEIGYSVSQIKTGAFDNSGIIDIVIPNNAYFTTVDGVLYGYGENDTGVPEARVIYNYLGSEIPALVEINGKEYTVVNP